jgi:hypothetical protein
MAGRLGQGSGSVEVDADRYFHNVVGPIFITHILLNPRRKHRQAC